jgi:hypothetical protein
VILFFSPETGFWGQDWDSLGVALTKASNELNGIKLMFSKMVAHQIQAHIMIFKTGSLEL